MKWKDITTYSQDEKDRKPHWWKANLGTIYVRVGKTEINILSHSFLFNLLLVIIIIAPQVVNLYKSDYSSFYNAGLILIWLIIPCRDKYFGKGRSLYWLRQTIFIFGALLVLILGLAL